MAERNYLTIAEVVAIHQRLIVEYGGDPGVRDTGLLESAVFRPQIGYYGNAVEEAAALMESLANNHPFIDGNKRIAFAAAHTHLLINGLDLNADPAEAFGFIMSSLRQANFRFAAILAWLEKHLVQD